MEKSFAKNKNLNYVALLFLVLLLAISLSACGSTTIEDLNNIINPPDNTTDTPSYEITGFGHIAEGAYFGTYLQIDNVTLSSGEFSFTNLIPCRVKFTSTLIKSISVTGDTATIVADGTVTDGNSGTSYSGSFDLNITIGDTDTFSITISNQSGNEVCAMDAQPIDMVNGNFTITTI